MKEKTRQFQCGDILYRFKFDLETGAMSVDRFEVVDVNTRGQVRTEYIDDEKPPKLVRQGVIFSPKDLVEQVKTKGTAKYVLLDENDPKKAAQLALEYVKTRLEEQEERVRRMRNWVAILEKLQEEGQDGK